MAATSPTGTVTCAKCGRVNRVPAAPRGKPRCGNCQAFLPWIVDAGDADFALIAEQATVPVLADLWATWCGPCRMVSPALEQLAVEKAGQLKLVKVDIDRAPILTKRFSIQAVPTLMVLHRGEVIARQPGAAPLDVLRRWLDDAIARIPTGGKD
jgi:thioredoxin 2